VGCCLSSKQLLQGTKSLLWLTEASKKVIHLIKYQKRFEWLRLFKQTILTAQPPLGFEDAILVPIPIHPKKFLERGFNQSEIIAGHLAAQWNVPVSFGLQKVVETLPQSQLNRDQRTENLIGCFSWNSRIKIPSKVILVDDILTTGETLYSCARALKNKGVESVFGWTLFRTIPRDIT
jgi:ComF family protein